MLVTQYCIDLFMFGFVYYLPRRFVAFFDEKNRQTTTLIIFMTNVI